MPFIERNPIEEIRNKNNDVLVNILTRTHNRPKHFNVCRESVLGQTHKNINHIVGSDCECDYYDTIKLSPKQILPRPDNLASYPAPWNLHLNELGTYVNKGWLMYLDDDDKFIDENSLKVIVSSIENEDQIILWRVNINNGMIVPNDEGFGKVIAGNISGIGFMFHSKHLPVDWGSWNFGDYRVISSLVKKISMKWINLVLTQTQGKPNFGGIPND